MLFHLCLTKQIFFFTIMGCQLPCKGLYKNYYEGKGGQKRGEGDVFVFS